MAKLAWDGMACECCLQVIANGEESGCRDYYGHTHTTATLNDRDVRLLNEENGTSFDGGQWAARAVCAAGEFDEDGGREVIYGCDFCDSVAGMAYGYPVSILI